MEFIKVLKKIRKNSDNNLYKGKHVLTNKLYCLKEINHDVAEGIPAAVIREISLLKELKHPNIVRLQNVWLTEMTITLSFEYVHLDLETYMHRLPSDFVFPLAVKQSYLRQIVSAIAFCHSRRIFHRNLCPRNILITRAGVIKITNFEAARSFEVTQKVYTYYVTMLWYRSPEILLGTSQYTPQIDTWAIGCIFAEMFLRKPIFNGTSEIDQMYKIANILGAPNKESWPEVAKLPYYFADWPLNKANRLKSTIPDAANVEIHLMKQMLKLNPLHRITAKRILEHQYFSNFNQNLRIPTIL